MAFKILVVGMLTPPAGDGVVEIVLPDQGFADDVAVCEGSMGVGEEVIEIEGFVGGYLEEKIIWLW